MIKGILQIEGAVLLLVSIYFYYYLNGNWLLFILFLFIPDISMIGYLKDKKLGAFIYNVVHNYILAICVIFAGMFLHITVIALLGTILFAHVSLDRFLGYGLKYSSAFKDTHLQKS